MIFWREVLVASEWNRWPTWFTALNQYLNSWGAEDYLWCGCGDEILLSEGIYYDEQGQYCCPICAETYHAKINGFDKERGGT